MREVETWVRYFCKQAAAVATRSKDPSTQVGCVIVDDDNSIISTGYNGMPPHMKETKEIWERPVKYDFVVHAETNAVALAAKSGRSLAGSTVYITHMPCSSCMKLLISSGVRRVICGAPIKGWDKEGEIVLDLASRCNISFKLESFESDKAIV